jgi:hypothetical protein
MVVIKVNFGSNPNDNVKLKLDKLNYEWAQNTTNDGKHYLNAFVDWNNYRAINGPYIWGGYPVQNCMDVNLNTKGYAEWHVDEISKVSANGGGDAYKERWHEIESKTGRNTIIDISPQIYTNEDKIESKMGGGASGSMLIDRYKNVIGIYWGGWGKTGSTFYPYFDIFNKSSFNYFDTYDTFLTPYMFS